MTTGKSRPDRPLSPHLQVYRWGWTMSLSIFHRFCGVVLSMGLLLLTAWLAALLAGPGAYAYVQQAMGHWYFQLVLAAWSVAFFYHLCNGVRHMLWDLGWGFRVEVAKRTGLTVVAGSLLLSVVSWLLAGGIIGGGS